MSPPGTSAVGQGLGRTDATSAAADAGKGPTVEDEKAPTAVTPTGTSAVGQALGRMDATSATVGTAPAERSDLECQVIPYPADPRPPYRFSFLEVF